jgi:hypothetical protein
MYLQVSFTDPDESTFAIFGTPDGNPAMSSGKTARLKRNDRYTHSLLRRDVDRVHDSLDHHIDSIGISGADVVAKLYMAMTALG